MTVTHGDTGAFHAVVGGFNIETESVADHGHRSADCYHRVEIVEQR